MKLKDFKEKLNQFDEDLDIKFHFEKNVTLEFDNAKNRQYRIKDDFLIEGDFNKVDFIQQEKEGRYFLTMNPF